LLFAALLLVIATISPWVTVHGPIGKTIFLTGAGSYGDGFLLFSLGLICLALVIAKEYDAAGWAAVIVGGIALYVGYLALTNASFIAARFYNTAFNLTWDIHAGVGAYLVIIAGLVLGKVIGIFGVAWLAIKLKIATLPQGSTMSQIFGVAFLGGIGNSAGYGIILVIVAFFRELLGSGEVFGFPVIEKIGLYKIGYEDNGLMILPPMALMVVGVIIWVQRSKNKELIEEN